MTIPKPKINPSSTLIKFKLISPDFCVAEGGGAVPFVHFVTNGNSHTQIYVIKQCAYVYGVTKIFTMSGKHTIVTLQISIHQTLILMQHYLYPKQQHG